uniref:Kelch domain containing 7A n=1 Tax=Podarcis muralis TaxID=64176 RepID=A0A670IX90_PODMU
MTPGVQVSGEQTSDMQLAARVALSAAAFLLLTLAYRYYKSRVPCGSQQGASGERGKGSEGAEGTESMVCCKEEELPPGLRHRWVNNKGEKPNHRAGGNPPLWAPGPAVFGESRGQDTPAYRKFSVAEEEKGGETSGAVLSNGNSAAVTETAMESEAGCLLWVCFPQKEPTVELVAGAKFFHIPLSSESSIDIHLDLGNCYEVLCTAKKQKLETLREAAYKVMSDNYLQVLRTHAIYSRLSGMERDLILQRRMQGRKYVTVADVSSQGESQHASRLCYYDDQKDTWHLLTHVPLEVVSKGCAMCSMFNYLFVATGCEGRGRRQKPSNRVFCYNPLTNIWREICPLNQARPHCKLVALDGYLYAIGGECLYTVERYDPRLDRWTFAAPLPNDTFAVAHTATACDGEIYVTGGTLRYMLLRYVGQTDTWKFSLTGGNKDRTTEMVTVNGFIYRFDLNRSMGISVYRCGARAKLWYECATHLMPFPASFQCAVVENLVYCIGRQFNIRFLADYVSPRFGTKELQTFPSPRGTLSPVTLVLPDREALKSL